MKKLLLILFAALIAVSSVSCGKKTDSVTDGNKFVMKIGTLKGPTGIGMAKLISDSKENGKYKIAVYSSPEEITSALITGSIDAASVPVNLAAVLNVKTDGKYKCAAVNTLGVLYLIENGTTVNSVADLSGKTVVTTGKGSTPEYIIHRILSKNGVNDCNIEYKTEAAEAMTLLVSGKADLAVLPEPNVTTALSKNPSLRVALDLTEEWEKIEDGTVVQGCVIVSDTAITEHKADVDGFLEDYEKSVQYVNGNAKDASTLVADTRIVPSAEVAEKAIPNCNIVFLTGDEMTTVVDGFFKILYEANPASVGGKVPNNDFYYER